MFLCVRNRTIKWALRGLRFRYVFFSSQKRALLSITTKIQHPADSHVSKQILREEYRAITMSGDPSITREYVVHGEQDSTTKFSLVSYNILANMFITDPTYCAFQYLTDDMKDPLQRHKRIMKELEYLDADLLCLQEVEEYYFNDFLLPDLKKLGYDGTLTCEALWAEGSATFYRTKRFELLDKGSHQVNELCMTALEGDGSIEMTDTLKKYLDQHGTMNVVKLKCKVTSKTFVLGNTHTFWGQEREEFDTQTLQIAMMIKYLESYSGESTFILCGDFNTEPHLPAYNMMHSKKLTEAGMKDMKSLVNIQCGEKKQPLIDILPRHHFEHDVTLESMYRKVLGKEPITYAGDHFLGTLDYILYDSRFFKSVGVLLPVHYTKKQEIPNEYLASDHLSIKGVLDFL